MITLEQLKESSFYQFVEEEGELKNARKMLRMLAAKRFPDLKLGEEVDRIHNLDALQRLGLEVLRSNTSLNQLQEIESARAACDDQIFVYSATQHRPIGVKSHQAFADHVAQPVCGCGLNGQSAYAPGLS